MDDGQTNCPFLTIFGPPRTGTCQLLSQLTINYRITTLDHHPLNHLQLVPKESSILNFKKLLGTIET